MMPDIFSGSPSGAGTSMKYFRNLFYILPIIALATTLSRSATGDIPIAHIQGSLICCPLDTIVLDGWASLDVGGEIVAWHWSINSQPPLDTVISTGELKVAAPFKPGTYSTVLLVKDNSGDVSAPESTTLHVMNSPPQVRSECDTTIKMGVRVAFNPHIQVNCGKIVSYEWDFNDDCKYEYTSNESPNTSRLFMKAGRYKVRFKAVDNYGREAGCLKTIVVSPQLPN